MLTPGEIVTANVAVAVFDAESATVTLNVGEPLVVGVPLSTPALERLRPAGAEVPPEMAHV